MRIIFIRHGDPDYVNDTLTEKGIREAKLLSERVSKWEHITQFYCSPLGRAQKTASYSLEKTGQTAITCDWLREFSYFIDDPVTGRHGVPWDLMPEYWSEIPQMYGRESWKETEIYRSNPELLPAYETVCQKLDVLLASYGYKRHNNYYTTAPKDSDSRNDSGRNARIDVSESHQDTIVIFCHLGITCMMLSHLLGISPVLLLHGFYLAPTSVTVLASEERMNGSAFFRVQTMGDTTHLLQGGEPISAAGYFTDVFQG